MDGSQAGYNTINMENSKVRIVPTQQIANVKEARARPIPE
jgi:hypothetical protein